MIRLEIALLPRLALYTHYNKLNTLESSETAGNVHCNWPGWSDAEHTHLTNIILFKS